MEVEPMELTPSKGALGRTFGELKSLRQRPVGTESMEAQNKCSTECSKERQTLKRATKNVVGQKSVNCWSAETSDLCLRMESLHVKGTFERPFYKQRIHLTSPRFIQRAHSWAHIQLFGHFALSNF